MPAQSRSSGFRAWRCAASAPTSGRLPRSGRRRGERRRAERGALGAGCGRALATQRPAGPWPARRAAGCEAQAQAVEVSPGCHGRTPHSLGWSLQELDETGVAVGVSAGRRPAGRRRPRPRPRSARGVCQSWISTRPPTSANSGNDRGEPQPPGRPAEAERSPRRCRAPFAPRHRCAPAARDLERALARKAQPLADIGRDVLGAVRSGGRPRARKARLKASRCGAAMVLCDRSSWLNSLGLQSLRQGMHRPGTVRLDAALRAAHGRGRLGDIEFLPVTQQEGLALTRRQIAPPRPRSLQDLRPRHRVGGAFGAVEPSERLERLQQVEIAVVAGGLEVARSSAPAQLRTFWRRNQSIVAFDRMRWNTSGSSAAGRSTYFSASRIIESCTMSSAASSSRTA